MLTTQSAKATTETTVPRRTFTPASVGDDAFTTNICYSKIYLIILMRYSGGIVDVAAVARWKRKVNQTSGEKGLKTNKDKVNQQIQ